tara:strand:- start:2095 stop:2670 length:576 start_codon:yes stop_codon:yes gene_type:complete
MADACDLLSTTTIGSAATSITVTGIPQTYQTLRIVSLLQTTGTAEFDGEVQVTFAGFGTGEYNSSAPAYHASNQGTVAKTAFSTAYFATGENATSRSTQFGAGWMYTGRNCNNTASMEILCSNYADTGEPLIFQVKSSKGAVASNTPRQIIQNGVNSTVSNGALTAVTFTTKSGSIDFTTASSVRIYGYVV